MGQRQMPPDALHDDQAKEGAVEETGSQVWKIMKVKELRELFQGIWKWVKCGQVEREVWEGNPYRLWGGTGGFGEA